MVSDHVDRSDIWKNFGYGTIIYLAAITGIDPGLYEAATIDGANRWAKAWHITLPGMRMVIVLLAVLSLGQLLNAGFDQVFNLYSPQVYESGEYLIRSCIGSDCWMRNTAWRASGFSNRSYRSF